MIDMCDIHGYKQLFVKKKKKQIRDINWDVFFNVRQLTAYTYDTV